MENDLGEDSTMKFIHHRAPSENHLNNSSIVNMLNAAKKGPKNAPLQAAVAADPAGIIYRTKSGTVRTKDLGRVPPELIDDSLIDVDDEEKMKKRGRTRIDRCCWIRQNKHIDTLHACYALLKEPGQE